MILLRLKINEPFRCLQQGLELYFQTEWDRSESRKGFAPYVLAGPNGSGKSNVLEALAAIFYHLECQYLTIRPQGFDYDEDENPQGFQDENSVPDAFELEYLTFPPVSPEYGDQKVLVHIKIVKVTGHSARVYLLNHPDVDADKPLPRTEAAEMLPEYVLAYSSGANSQKMNTADITAFIQSKGRVRFDQQPRMDQVWQTVLDDSRLASFLSMAGITQRDDTQRY